jgi:2-hydroxy-3-oxopropionate reductase
MAGRLADAGFPVRAWNRNPARTAKLTHTNAKHCATASEAVAGSDVVIVMLSSGPVVDEVLFNPDPSGHSPADMIDPSALVIVMSSIPVETAKAQAERLSQKDVRFLDAPVSGGEPGAKDGTLTIMTGGTAQDFDRAAPVFAPLGRAVHVGPVGSGQLSKLANQLIVGVTIAAVSEAMILAEAGGADPAAVRDALLGGFADSAILRQHGQRIIDRNFTPGGHATTQLKDLKTASDHAASLGRSLPFLNLCREEFEAMCRHDMGDYDHSGLYLELEKKSRTGD